MKAIVATCRAEGECAQSLEFPPLSDARDEAYSVPVFAAWGPVRIEDYCVFPGRQEVWAVLAPALHAYMRQQGIDTAKADAARKFAATYDSDADKGTAVGADSDVPADEDPEATDESGPELWAMHGFVEHGTTPKLGLFNADESRFRNRPVPASRLARAAEIVDYLRAHPSTSATDWAQRANVVVRNNRPHAVTVNATHIELLSYGGYPPGQGDSGEGELLALPKGIPLSGVDTFDLDALLPRAAKAATRSIYPVPFNLEPGMPLRREVRLISRKGGFFVWRIGFDIGASAPVWSRPRCHFTFPPSTY